MQKRYFSLLAIALIPILILATTTSPTVGMTVFFSIQTGELDPPVNEGIFTLKIEQNDTGVWTDITTITNSTYDPLDGFDVTLDVAKEVRFTMNIYINTTHGTDANEAANNTRVNMTLSGSGGVGTIYDDVGLYWNTTTYLAGESAYRVEYYYDWNTTIPAEGIVYSITFYYYMYY